jgi:sporulation protein YlmC with PRC-barrel domain
MTKSEFSSGQEEFPVSENDYQSAVDKEVYTNDGANVGHVTEIVSQDGKPAFLQVKENGLFGIGAESFLVPVDAVTGIDGDHVNVNKSREDLVGIPAHDGHEPKEPGYFESLYAWWWRADEN